MSWLDRLLPARYTSPSGVVVSFIYEDLSQSTTRKTSAYTFPDADGTYVQDLGVGSRRFPMRLWFTGPDCDLLADEFDRALAERGAGVLNHPQRGAITVVPFGDVTRRDDLKSAANQVAYEVTFYETTGLLWPTPAAATGNQSAYQLSAAQDLARGTNLATAVERAQERAGVLLLLDDVEATLRPIADGLERTRGQFDAVYTSILTGVDLLLGTPATLAAQFLELINIPRNAGQTIANVTRGYVDLIGSVLELGPPRSSNDLQIRALITGGALSSASAAAVGATYQSRGEAVILAASLLDLFDVIGAWRDQRPADVEDVGESYADLLEQVAQDAGAIVDRSFALAQERRVVLDQPRTIIELAAEFYGDAEQLDRLITSNDFTGSEILLVPEGRSVVFYR